MRRRSTVAPHDVNRAFWSSRSAFPGKRGNAFVYGHTYDSRPSGVGVFDHLKRLRRGQVISMVIGGKTLSYRVTRVQNHARLNLSEREMAKLLSRLGRSRTTWTTCLWSAKHRKYVSRVLVRAVLID